MKTTSAEHPLTPAQQRVVRAQCGAYNRRGERCDRNAEAAVVENGDHVPVCSFHKRVAMNVGWAIGPLRDGLWSIRLGNMKENDIIIIESEDGILHEMLVKSVNQDNRTVTGEVANWKSNLVGHQAVKTVTVPDHSIREIL